MSEQIPPAAAGQADGAQVQSDAEDADLASSLAKLAQLAVGHGQQGLEDMLSHVAVFATQAIPGADGAGLTLFENDRADTLVASATFVREIDAIQYGIGEGTCISAAAEGRTMRSGSLGGDPLWPHFGPRVGRLGVHSVLSLPLVGPGGVLGAMNVYAHRKNSFDDRAVQLGELFAVPAAISVMNAQALTQARRLAVHLQGAMTTRATIDHALGIIMSRAGCTADEAFYRLRGISQTDHLKVVQVARNIVNDAVKRARARHTHTEMPDQRQ
jgi:GAF domain-containing protein